MKNLQAELRKGTSPEELAKELSLSIKRHSSRPELALFKYSMIESPMDNPIVQESRGIVLNSNDNWNLVSWAFPKFFNYGERHAAEIDWSTARVYEKLDGSLIQLYHYDGEWHVGTSGVPCGTNPVYGAELTFGRLFWKTFEAQYGKNVKLDPDICYAFELMTAYNKVVVRHMQPRVVLIGKRHVPTGLELEPVDPMFECVRIFDISSIADCIASSKELDPLVQEGYIVCDARFNRIKIKSPQYVAVHHMKSSYSLKKHLTIIQQGEGSEFSTLMPEYAQETAQLSKAYEKIIKDTELVYEQIKTITDRKSYALEAQKYPFSGVLFALLMGGSVRHHYSELRIEHLMKILGLKEYKE